MSKREDGDSTADGMVSDMPTTSSMIGDVIVVGGGSALVQKGNRTAHNTSAKPPTATNIATAGTHSNFGINIQKREVHTKEYSPQQLYGAPVPSGNSFLQARNIGANSGSMPEADDDFVSLIGADRWHRNLESSNHSQNINSSTVESASMSVSASVNFSSSLKLSTGESGSCSFSDWLSTSHSEENHDNDSNDDDDHDDNPLTPNAANIRDIRQMSDSGGDNIVVGANVAYNIDEQHGHIEMSPNHITTRRSRQRPANNEHIT